MAAKRHDRTRARRAALQVLYSGEINQASPSQLVDEGLALQDESEKLSNYAISLVYGVDSHRMGIDACLDRVSDNWALDRMPIVDRSILRLAVYEMLYVDAVPVSVTINEAVELAKDFGGEDESSRFVNGVLGRVAKLIEEGKIGAGIGLVPDEDDATPDADVVSETEVAPEADADETVNETDAAGVVSEANVAPETEVG